MSNHGSVRFLGLLAIALLLSAGRGAHAAVWLQFDVGTHAAPIVRLAVDERRDAMVTASWDKTARIWSLRSGQLRAVLRPPVGAAQVGQLFGAAIHPTRDLVALGGTTATIDAQAHSIWLFELSTGRFVRRIDARGGHVRRLRWSEDGGLLFAAYGDRPAVRAFSIDGALVLEEALDADALALSARGDRVAVVARSGDVRIWRVQGEIITPLGRFATERCDPIGMDFSSDGSRLAVAYFAPSAGGDVYRVPDGQRVATLSLGQSRVCDPGAVRSFPVLNAQAVAFVGDGRRVVLGGARSLGRGQANGELREFDASSGAPLRDMAVSGDSILDLWAPATPSADPAGADAIAWASFDGSWGVYAGGTAVTRVAPSFPFRVLNASELKVSADTRKVRWVRTAPTETLDFDLPNRALGPSNTPDLRDPVLRTSMFESPPVFADNFRPVVRGRAIELRTGERSRAFAYLGDTGRAVLASDQGIRLVESSGSIGWQVLTATEVRAVNGSADGRLLVTAMTDGTVRWWRASDGALLLSLLVVRDGWVLWTPTGHFDASHGGDALIGWLVDREGSPVPDYFSVGRFRDRYHRADVIDRVLELLDVDEAVRQADATAAIETDQPAAFFRPQSLGPSSPGAAPSSTQKPVDRIDLSDAILRPPVLMPLEPLRLEAGNVVRTFRFGIRADSGRDALRIEVRVDGRLQEPVKVVIPDRLDGGGAAEVSVAIESNDARTVQMVARDGERVSEPLRYRVEGNRTAAIEPTRANGTLYVLSIGVAEYRDPGWILKLSAKDAVDFVTAMRQQRTGLYEKIEERVLVDAAATRDEVLRGLGWLKDRVGPDDVGIVFLAGHGVNDRSGRFHFLPADADPKRPLSNTVTGHDLTSSLSRLKGRAILFMDTCHAGSVADALRDASRETTRLANGLAAAENAVSVFASSSARQESFELASWSNGAFTKFALEGLMGAARLPAADIVTMRSLNPFVRSSVSRLTGGRQTPVALIPDSLPDRILASVPDRQKSAQ